MALTDMPTQGSPAGSESWDCAPVIKGSLYALLGALSVRLFTTVCRCMYDIHTVF